MRARQDALCRYAFVGPRCIPISGEMDFRDGTYDWNPCLLCLLDAVLLLLVARNLLAEIGSLIGNCLVEVALIP